MNALSMVVAGLALAATLGCPPNEDTPIPRTDDATIEGWLRGVDTLVVRDSQDQTVATISDRQTMRAFVSLLPKSEFDDIFNEAGRARYSVEFVGGGRGNNYMWITDTHVRYVPKGAARLSGRHRTALLQALGVGP
jgi:hypothetical protein